jgi:hypothetical protein
VNSKRLLVENSILPGVSIANHVSKKKNIIFFSMYLDWLF